MRTVSSDFKAKNIRASKQPVYLMHFDGETTDYVTSPAIISPNNDIKPWIVKISGLSQSIIPEEGRSSIGQITVSLLDYWENGVVWEEGIDWGGGIDWEESITWDITNLIGSDPYNLHRRKTIIKGGYRYMQEASMATLMTGWVTGIKLQPNALVYDFVITDLQKWLQKKIFRSASDSSPVQFEGNPMDILLSILLSSGAIPTNRYDYYDEENSVGLDSDMVNIAHIESEKEKWFHGVWFSFDLRESMTAKKFIEDQICKVCNIYPLIKGDGTFDIKVYRPPFPEEIGTVQEFDRHHIKGIPKWDQNLQGMINEVVFKYDRDAANNRYDTEDYHSESESYINRGPGKKQLEVSSMGLTTARGGEEFSVRRVRRVFARYATPPPKLNMDTLFSRQLSEAGDVCPVTNDKVPNLKEATRGVSSKYMEIVDRQIDWLKGQCKFTFLHTGFTGKRFGLISPAGTVASGASYTAFTLGSGEGDKFEVGWVIDLFKSNMIALAAAATITTITADQITVQSSLGMLATAGWKITFSSYDNCIQRQKDDYCFICKSNDRLGAANDEPHRIY